MSPTYVPSANGWARDATPLTTSQVSALGAVHSLKLFSCHGVADVSSLTAVHTLTLCDCPNVPSAQVATLRSLGVTAIVYVDDEEYQFSMDTDSDDGA